LYGGQVKFFADFAIVASATTAENVQNKSLGIRLFRAFEHSNLEFVSYFAIRISNFKIQKLRVFVQTLIRV